MRLLYSLLLTVGVLVTAPLWLWKARRQKKYCGYFRQRLGWKVPVLPPGPKPLWLHAVSVGEVLAARPVYNEIRRERKDLPLIVSTVTLTGQDLARREFKDAAAVFFFPFDWYGVVNRFFRRLKPRGVVIVETELWPNFLAAARRRGIPVLLVNGRLSDRSVRRYRWIRPFAAQMLRGIERIGTQTAEDRQRFLQIGARQETVRVTGNLKFDFPAPLSSGEPPWLPAIRSALGDGGDLLNLVVGSSMKGEEPLFIEAFRRIHRELPQARLVLAPRHPERFAEVASLLGESGLRFLRRTELSRSAESSAEVVLLDTIGELPTVYALAAIAVIGGSFLPFGGHNILEPAALGKPIVFGPHMSNFREIAGMFLREQAARETAADRLAETLLELLRDSRARETLGQRALSTVRQNQGATEATMAWVRPYLD